MYRRETSELRIITRSSTFRMVLTFHAEQQMLARHVARLEVERVIKLGSVTMIETDPDGTELWRVSGRNSDGRRIEIVIEPIPSDMVSVITVIA